MGGVAGLPSRRARAAMICPPVAVLLPRPPRVHGPYTRNNRAPATGKADLDRLVANHDAALPTLRPRRPHGPRPARPRSLPVCACAPPFVPANPRAARRRSC